MLSCRHAQLETQQRELERARIDLAIKDAQLALLRAELAPFRGVVDLPQRVSHMLRDRLRAVPALRRTLMRFRSAVAGRL